MNTLMEKEMRKLAESGNSVDVIGSLLNFNQRATGSLPVCPSIKSSTCLVLAKTPFGKNLF
jgi:hypothetical protein